jgi:hypothetical protein
LSTVSPNALIANLNEENVGLKEKNDGLEQETWS